MKTKLPVFFVLALMAVVGCAQKGLDREQASKLIEVKVFPSEDWKYRRFEGVTGITTGADGRSAVVEFKFAFPQPAGEEWREKSFLAKVAARLYDDGWRIEGTPEPTQIMSAGDQSVRVSLPTLYALAWSEARLIAVQKERHDHPLPTVISLEEQRALSEPHGPTPVPAPPTSGTIRMRGKTIPVGPDK